MDWLGAVPVQPGLGSAYPLVVYSGHGLCAGNLLRVKRMSAPHMHSQIEVNFVLKGFMTYRFNGKQITVSQGSLALFWGMVPHQVVDCADDASFVCLYLPLSMFLELPNIQVLRESVLRGSLIVPRETDPTDDKAFLRWRQDLLSGDVDIVDIARHEISSRIRRLARSGWRDANKVGDSQAHAAATDSVARLDAVERMLRFIGEHALEDIDVPQVAGHVGLHPNYATSLFRKALGLTINQSIVQHRLDAAQSMLACSDMPITSVAFEAGFGSVSRFYKAFHDRFSMRPGAYRDSIRGRIAAD